MTVTASSMIFNALIMNGEKSPGGTLTSAEASYHLDRLSAMLDSWGIEKLMCYQVLQESFPLTASTATYTIGNSTSATLSTARPNDIIQAFVRDNSTSDSGVQIIDAGVYNTIIGKGTGNSYPRYLYYEKSYPLATIKLYPLPIAGLTLFIESMKQLQSFANISTVISLPPGYQRAIESNYAIEAAPGFTTVSPEVLKIAKESKAAIKSLNIQDIVMRIDPAVVNRVPGNIITGP